VQTNCLEVTVDTELLIEKEENDGLMKDVCRIWRRNLGRDDHLMSDHGREVRFRFWMKTL
jgi:asparagine synthetase B (glutamine-hydrolysing)